MKERLFHLLENSGELSVQSIFFNILMAAALGMFIFFSYMITHKGTIYSKKFNVSLVVLTVLTGTVMTVIGNNIALSLGMVGALSIVRFRTAIKDSRDTIYIFWTVIVGICCGVGDYVVASVGSAVTFVILLLFGMINNDNRMLLIIRASRKRYEISSQQLKKVEEAKDDFVDSIYDLGGIEYVNVVMQNDEVSN